MRRSILIVEDDPGHGEALSTLLATNGFTVRAAADARAALAELALRLPDLVISDVGLPGSGGVELVAALRADPRTADLPVLLVSGERRDPADQATGLELGADDYLTKPYEPRLLLAKVEALLARCGIPGRLALSLARSGLSVDLRGRSASLRGRRLPLAPRELGLLGALARARGRVLSPAVLLERAWGRDLAEDNDPHTVATHVASLRRKLGAWGRRIVTVPGAGYRLDL